MQAVIGQKLIGSLKANNKPYEVRDSRTNGFILRVQPSGVMSYICEYGRGKRITIGRVGQITPVQARERAQEILADVIKGSDPQAAKKSAKSHTLESYITDVYAPWSQANHRNSASALDRIKRSFLPAFGDCKLADITPWHIEKWRSERIKAGTKKLTVNHDVAALKAALRRAVDWGYLQSNPLTTIKPMKTDHQAVIRYLTDVEEHSLRKTLESREARIKKERESANNWRKERGYNLLPSVAGDYLRPMVILTLNTGLRRGELFNLKWEDIDLDQAMLAVKGHGAKSGQTRYIPLNDEALYTLKDWYGQGNGSDLVFPGKNGNRFDNINKSWRKLLKDSGIVNFRFHDIRHSFASKLVMAGVDLNTVRELLGHADIKMTLRYAHLAPEHKRKAVEKLNFPTRVVNEQSKSLPLA